MTIYDPSTAPRQRDSGFKGDGWIVTIPSDGAESVLALDTGLDSAVILRVANGKWDRGEQPPSAHVHHDHDETIVITTGSGTLYHGPDPEHVTTTRFEGPIVLVAPAGAYHHVVMDPDVTASGTCFFTVPGTVLVPFADRKPLNQYGKVTFADLRVVDPPHIEATVAPGSALDPKIRGTLVDDITGVDGPAVRFIPYEQPEDGYVLPLDTGHDSLFMMVSRGRSWDRAPAVVDVHSHADVDEFIVIDGGEGFLLNGPDLGSVTLTAFRGPCLIVMPAGAFHRIVRTDDEGVDSILVYTDRRAVVEPFARIMERTTFIPVGDGAREGDAR